MERKNPREHEWKLPRNSYKIILNQSFGTWTIIGRGSGLNEE